MSYRENYISQKLLGVTIDKKLNFNEHVSYLCNKMDKKRNAIARIFLVMPLEKKKFDECLFSVTVWVLSIAVNELQQGNG